MWLLLESIGEGILLIFQHFFMTGQGYVFAGVGLLVLPQFLERCRWVLRTTGKVAGRKVERLFVDFKGSKGSEHAVNYRLIYYNIKPILTSLTFCYLPLGDNGRKRGGNEEIK